MGEMLKTSEILILAKKRLWDGRSAIKPRGKSQYICHAVGAEDQSPRVMRLRVGAEDLSPRVMRLREEIARRLAPNITLAGWLQDVAMVPEDQLTYENVQRHRRQWVDRLVEEYEAEGD